MKILVTGGAGFLGSHLCEAMLAREHEVWAIDAKGEAKILHLLNHPNFHFVRETIFNEAMLEDLHAALKAQHAAAERLRRK